MPAVKYNTFDTWISKNKPEAVPQIYLIFGESFFVREAYGKLTGFLASGDTGSPVETLEGGSVSVGDIIEEVSTFSFLVSRKIVAVKNIPLFQAKSATGETGFSSEDLESFSRFVSRALPDNHFLILTCPAADKRKKLFKTLEENGLVIDCAVSQGSRKADIDEQQQVLKSLASRLLTENKKKIDQNAFSKLSEITGFNLDVFSQNLNKLIAYTGERPGISIDDVNAVVVRDKKDPIFNLTNALADKNQKACFFYLDSLLKEGFHYLQILKSFENQVRKLLLVKAFVAQTGGSGKTGFRQMGFNTFKQQMLPKVIEHDKSMKAAVKVDKKKKSPQNDLLLAPNPKSPYPVYQVFLKSENFSITELTQALIFLSDLDYKLKSSAIDAKAQIEIFIIQLCSKGGFTYDSQKHKNRRYHI